jgi:hypothetical protein
MAKRKPQINFQVDESMKVLYEESRAAGHWVTRFCAAGLLLLVEDPVARMRALNRLREWEAEYADASPEEIREFVQGAQAAMQGAAPRNRPAPKARRGRRKAKRSGSA